MPRSSIRRDGTRTRLRWRCRRSRRDYPGRFAIMGAHDIIFSSNVRMAAPGHFHPYAASSAIGCRAPKAVAGTRVDLRNPKFEWRADPPLYRGLRERCRNGGGMGASHGGLNYASIRAGLWPP